MYMFVVGTVKSYGVLYTEMLTYFGGGSGNTAWIGSVCLLLMLGLGRGHTELCFGIFLDFLVYRWYFVPIRFTYGRQKKKVKLINTIAPVICPWLSSIPSPWIDCSPGHTDLGLSACLCVCLTACQYFCLQTLSVTFDLYNVQCSHLVCLIVWPNAFSDFKIDLVTLTLWPG